MTEQEKKPVTAEEYYRWTWGVYPHETMEPMRKTQGLIDHLADNHFESKDIMRFISEAPKKDYLTPEDLPDWMWEGSLLKRDTFYFHRALQLVSKAPQWAPGKTFQSEKLFLEMRIRYTMDNLFFYCMNALRIPIELIDKKKSIGALNFLLKKYEKISFAEPIDMVMLAVDLAAKELPATADLLAAIQIMESEAFIELKNRTANARGTGQGKVIWRM